MKQSRVLADVSIPDAAGADASRISRLLQSLSYTYTTFPDGKGAEAFLATLNEPAITLFIARSDVTYLIAESRSGTAIAWAAALRANDVVAHSFVDPSYLGMGLGRRLWELLRDGALRAGNPGLFSANSSVSAVPVYERFGSVVVDAKVEKDGEHTYRWCWICGKYVSRLILRE
jgi:GNAT superfamily N-acetyltransferase